ncbi:MAG: guanine deaminase, partial [Betaproteobacteria bacterium]
MTTAPHPGEDAGGGGLRAFRGTVLHFVDDPLDAGAHAYEHFPDGLLVVDDGVGVGAGEATAALARLPAGTPVVDRTGYLILPGFVDTHIHYPQTDMIAAYGEQLLAWLERYTYPAEQRFGDIAHAREVAEFFLDELLRCGTTTALVYATVHPESADAFFAAAQARGTRMIAGKVLMDRNCPEFLRDTAESGYADSKALIGRWHGKARLSYAVTPRFAPASTERQLELAGRLLDEHPGVYLQTHVAENRAEVAWAAELFPWSRSYLGVYDRFGLVRRRSVFAHCLYLDEADRARMGAAGAAMAFCPSSNLFLGSGPFDLDAARRHGVRVGLGTDVGAGTSFSQLRTLDAAYKVVQLAGQRLSPLSAFYLATLGSARALYLDDRIGNFLPGKEADFIVIDPAATPLLARRTKHASNLQDTLFALMMLGDDRAIAET